MTEPAKNGAAADLLHGFAAIGEYLGLTTRQVKHRAAEGELPFFRMGRAVCARRSELEAHFARASAARRGSALPAVGAGEAPTQSAAVLYDHRAIAAHLDIPVADVTRLDAERRLPTYQDDGCTVASAVALDHWSSLKGGVA